MAITTEDWQSYTIGQLFTAIADWNSPFAVGGLPQVVASTLIGGRAGGQPGAGGSENMWVGKLFNGDAQYNLEWQSNGSSMEFYFHMDNARQNGYQINMSMASGSTTLFRIDSGVGTQLASVLQGNIPNLVPQTLEFKRVGNNIDVTINGSFAMGVVEGTYLAGTFGFGGTANMEIGIVTVNDLTGPALVISILTMRWNLFVQAISQLTMLWNLLTTVKAPLTMIWNVVGRITRVLTVVWDLLNKGRTTTPQTPSIKKVTDAPLTPSVKKILKRGD